MTLELLHGIRGYTLTRTSIPNHAGNIIKIELAIVSAVAARFGLFSMNDQSVDLSLSLYFT